MLSARPTFNHVRFAQRLALVAGLLDFGTGLGLVFFPTVILPIMRLQVPSDDALVFLRFVGAFVGAVGTSYLWALLRGGGVRLSGVLEFTLFFRLAAGTFSSIAIARGWLAPGWMSVPVTDFALVGIQLWLLSKLPTLDVPSSSPSTL
jgi:hypothetical protein